ncbi:histidine phosphatase family protein [Malacoplasma iowae]|uniref:histidine phosphatase family protein n=1 Tax=Malacoplasma iowae TaxID=2116 RepID=UPI0038731CC3|nr:histidine phosphatase family protein [Malacoplasma iowae]
MEIYVLRHCKTECNLNNKWCGSKSDIGLSIEGKIQNEKVVKELSKINFDYIFTSPLKRCLVTSKQISKNTNSKLVIDNRLIERNFGELEGLNCNNDDKIKLADFELNTDLNKNVEKIYDMFFDRVLPFIKDIEKIKAKKILIVTHSWVIRLFNYFFSNEVKNNEAIKMTPKNGEYKKFIINNDIISRHFNTLIVKGNKITKKSAYLEKFNDEINWMVSIPNELKDFVPKIYDYRISTINNDKDFSYIRMEYINKKSFEQFFINEKLTNKEASIFFKHIDSFLKKTKEYNKEIDDNEKNKLLYNIYYLKTIDRVNSIKDDHNLNFFYNNKIIINNKEYYSIKTYMEKLLDVLNGYNLLNSKEMFCIIHGDLCFNNIIFNDNKMYLIDPRGSFGEKGIYGDQIYELAKISHSISGYDSIINNLFYLNVTDKNQIYYCLKKNDNEELFRTFFEKMISSEETLKKVYLVESLLFLSMIPLHKENYRHQLVMLSIAIEKLSKFIT